MLFLNSISFTCLVHRCLRICHIERNLHSKLFDFISIIRRIIFPLNRFACSLFLSHNYSLCCLQRSASNHDCFVHTKLHTILTKFLLTIASFGLLFYMHISSVWWRFLKWNIRSFTFSRIFLQLPYCLYSNGYLRIPNYSSCLLLMVYVFDGFVTIYYVRIAFCCVFVLSLSHSWSLILWLLLTVSMYHRPMEKILKWPNSAFTI